MRPALAGLVLTFLTVPPLTAQTDVPVRDADEFRKAVAAAKPGDRILLAPGDYRGGFTFRGVRGAAGKPVVIAAADPARPPRFVGQTICLHFAGPCHLELADLVLTGSSSNGLNIDDGGAKGNGPAHHITLRNLRVTDIGPKGNVDGIKLSGLDDFRLEGCTVERWGSGGSAVDMVGCHRGRITGCAFRSGGSNAVQIKGGSADVAVRGCRFEDYGERGVNAGGSTGDPFFRPPLKDMPADGKYEAKDVRVEGCVFVGGQAAVAAVGADGVVFRFNTIHRPVRNALRILQEKRGPGFVPCRNGVFEDNVVVFRSERWSDGGVNVGPNTAPETFRFSRNLWYCEDRPDRSAPKLPTPEVDGVVGKDPLFRDPAKRDFGVKPDSPAAGRGAHALPDEKK